MNEQIKKASAVYIQDYWNKIEEIEQEKCQREIRHVPLYHQQILELDAIQFTQNVLFCINDQLVDLLNKQRICLAYKQVMPVNVQPVRWLQESYASSKTGRHTDFCRLPLYSYPSCYV